MARIGRSGQSAEASYLYGHIGPGERDVKAKDSLSRAYYI